MSLTFEPVWNWPLVIVTTVGMLAIVIGTYPAQLKRLSPIWRNVLFILRLLSAFVLIFAMLRPALQYSETDEQLSQLVILVDRSRSMGTPDAVGGLTRREALLKILKENEELFKTLTEEVEIRFVDFAMGITPIPTPENETDGAFTAIGKTLDELREQERSDRLIGVVLMSDGAQRSGGEDDIDPLLAARRFAEQRGVPIHTMTFGTSELSTSGLDLAIEDLTLDQPVTFERKLVPVRMQVRLLGAAGRQVRVRLLIEDRTGKTLGESGELKEMLLTSESRPFKDIQTDENSVTLPLELSFIAEKAGEYKIAAEVVPQDGEIKLQNNRLETLITVRKGGLKVAYIDVPRPEQKFLRRLNETAKIQLDTQVVLPGKLGGQTRIDPNLFEAGKYDVYLIGDVPAEVFKVDGRDMLPQLAARVREGAGLGMLGGLHNFGAGGYAATPLVNLLPVKMTVAEQISADQEAPENHFATQLRMVPTPAGEQHYLMRLAANNNQDAWLSLPELGGASRLEAKSGAVEVLAESASGEPLLFATDTGGGRALALAVDETWKWHLHGYEAEHQRFWQQLVLWLARKEYESDQPIWVRVEPRNFSPMSKVPLEFGAQDADGKPIENVVFDVEVIKPDNESETVTPRKFADHGLADFTKTLQPGDYWARVSASKDGQGLGVSGLTRFIVDARDIEMDNPAADPGLMEELAAMTGGMSIQPEEFKVFLERLIEEGIPKELKRFRRLNLWDNWPLLLIFVGLLSVEWTIRKLRGLV